MFFMNSELIFTMAKIRDFKIVNMSSVFQTDKKVVLEVEDILKILVIGRFHFSS